MYLLILLLPLLGFIFTIGFGRYIGLGSFLISTSSIGLTLLLTIIAFYEVVYNYSIVYIDLGYWLNLTHIQIGWSFIFDSITVSMLFIITLISFLVHFYSIYYMYTDKHYPRFMAYLSLFTFFMILLVTSNNLLLMFFGWEGYLNSLIWYNNNNINFDSLFGFLFLSNNKIKAEQRIGPHNFDILSLIIGSLLGDSHIEKRNKGFRLIFEQCNNNVEYLMWFHNFLAIRGYCNQNIPKLHKRIKKDNKVFFHYRINTYTFNSFYWIHDMFYKWDSNKQKYIKIVPSNLSEYLSPMALAILFMDDGSKTGSSVRIATNSFTLEEINELCKILFIKYNIIATAQKAGKNKGYILYIHKKSLDIFINLVNPYMINSLKYKLGIK
jgi:heme/copper-type cytochrome/quinol oxidase subunit 4